MPTNPDSLLFSWHGIVANAFLGAHMKGNIRASFSPKQFHEMLEEGMEYYGYIYDSKLKEYGFKIGNFIFTPLNNPKYGWIGVEAKYLSTEDRLPIFPISKVYSTLYKVDSKPVPAIMGITLHDGTQDIATIATHVINHDGLSYGTSTYRLDITLNTPEVVEKKRVLQFMDYSE